MSDADRFYLDHVQLRARGWTRTMVERFLVRPDRWETVNHWANFKGKATYFVERVLLAEHSPAFKRAFEASARRRRLALQALTEIATARALVDDEYRAWLKTVTPEDVQRMLLISEAARFFEEARARGYRTPHK
jgi:hypothetical protein